MLTTPLLSEPGKGSLRGVDSWRNHDCSTNSNSNIHRCKTELGIKNIGTNSNSNFLGGCQNQKNVHQLFLKAGGTMLSKRRKYIFREKSHSSKKCILDKIMWRWSLMDFIYLIFPYFSLFYLIFPYFSLFYLIFPYFSNICSIYSWTLSNTKNTWFLLLLLLHHQKVPCIMVLTHVLVLAHPMLCHNLWC